MTQQKNIFKLLLLSITIFSYSLGNGNTGLYDVTVIGCLHFSSGIGRNAIAALDYLQDDLKMNYIDTRPQYSTKEDLPPRVKNFVKKNTMQPSNVAILYEALKLPHNVHYHKVPNSKIKIAFSMVESTAIPLDWVTIINTQFDAVAVPDIWLVDVYKQCGVKKPIFVAPHPIYIDDFLALPSKTHASKIFTFGTSSALSDNKNCPRLIAAFIQEFGNNPKVRLVIQTTYGARSSAAVKIKKELAKKKIKNVQILHGALQWTKYVRHMGSLDCYVLISKGEGFSVTPREAMAAGIPCIISNNTAHKTICNSGLVYSIPSNIVEKNVTNGYGETLGYNFNCHIADVRKGLRDVYAHYNDYLEKAHLGREWVAQYRGENLKQRYINLFKPSKVLMGPENIITNDYLMTNDLTLFNKYNSIS